ncbi:hypothetical protein QFZ72_003889 [Bacillus sp. V2I10]|nr:hypothetical protein [Bacillus sp. V2I10]
MSGFLYAAERIRLFAISSKSSFEIPGANYSGTSFNSGIGGAKIF